MGGSILGRSSQDWELNAVADHPPDIYDVAERGQLAPEEWTPLSEVVIQDLNPQYKGTTEM